jgi:hypothetical protein
MILKPRIYPNGLTLNFQLNRERLNTMSNFKETLLNVLTCIGFGLALCVGLMAYFDILVK